MDNDVPVGSTPPSPVGEDVSNVEPTEEIQESSTKEEIYDDRSNSPQEDKVSPPEAESENKEGDDSSSKKKRKKDKKEKKEKKDKKGKKSKSKKEKGDKKDKKKRRSKRSKKSKEDTFVVDDVEVVDDDEEEEMEEEKPKPKGKRTAKETFDEGSVELITLYGELASLLTSPMFFHKVIIQKKTKISTTSKEGSTPTETSTSYHKIKRIVSTHIAIKPSFTELKKKLETTFHIPRSAGTKSGDVMMAALKSFNLSASSNPVVIFASPQKIPLDIEPIFRNINRSELFFQFASYVGPATASRLVDTEIITLRTCDSEGFTAFARLKWSDLRIDDHFIDCLHEFRQGIVAPLIPVDPNTLKSLKIYMKASEVIHSAAFAMKEWKSTCKYEPIDNPWDQEVIDLVKSKAPLIGMEMGSFTIFKDFNDKDGLKINYVESSEQKKNAAYIISKLTLPVSLLETVENFKPPVASEFHENVRLYLKQVENDPMYQLPPQSDADNKKEKKEPERVRSEYANWLLQEMTDKTIIFTLDKNRRDDIIYMLTAVSYKYKGMVKCFNDLPMIMSTSSIDQVIFDRSHQLGLDHLAQALRKLTSPLCIRTSSGLQINSPSINGGATPFTVKRFLMAGSYYAHPFGYGAPFYDLVHFFNVRKLDYCDKLDHRNELKILGNSEEEDYDQTFSLSRFSDIYKMADKYDKTVLTFMEESRFTKCYSTFSEVIPDLLVNSGVSVANGLRSSTYAIFTLVTKSYSFLSEYRASVKKCAAIQNGEKQIRLYDSINWGNETLKSPIIIEIGSNPEKWDVGNIINLYQHSDVTKQSIYIIGTRDKFEKVLKTAPRRPKSSLRALAYESSVVW